MSNHRIGDTVTETVTVHTRNGAVEVTRHAEVIEAANKAGVYRVKYLDETPINGAGSLGFYRP